MAVTLAHALETLRAHEADLHRLGVRHASIFGSVAREDARPDSDLDVLLDLDPHQPMGLFEYSRVKLHIADLLGKGTDIVNKKTLKPPLREAILRDALSAF